METDVCKTTYPADDGHILDVDVFFPQNRTENMPAAALFFGGGWLNGTRERLHPQCRFLSEAGYVVFVPDYRVFERQGVSPRECVQDAACFWTFLSNEAARFGVDPARIALGGSSAGGHVSIMAGLKTGVLPKAYILYNPVLRLEGEWFFGDIVSPRRDAYPPPNAGLDYHNFDDISPVKQFAGQFPPVILLQGSDDAIVPASDALGFAQILRDNGINADVHIFDGAGHGFFYPDRSEKYFNETNQMVLEFMERVV